jgi:hypothetical protein
MELGSVVLDIRRGKSYANKQADLESIGFNYGPKNKSRYRGYELIKAALQTYEDLHGDMLVPATFVVPTNDTTWPEETRGLNLGSVVSNIRLEQSYVKNRADLESIGFDFNSQQKRYGYKSIQVALVKYKDLNGDLLVPAGFVVPPGDIIWPEETWDMNLGTAVSNINQSSHNVKNQADFDRRGRKSYIDKRSDLGSSGFNFNSQKLKAEIKKQRGYEVVKVALQTYEDLHGDMLVPAIFVVPEDDTTWPEETWGLNLGRVVSRVRAGKSHVKNRADLESIGFQFSKINLQI